MSSSSPAARTEANARKRVVNACRGCKQRKVKCSGTAPCLNCINRDQPCTFDKPDRRIIISERHWREVQRRAAISQSQGQSPDASNRESFVTPPQDRRRAGYAVQGETSSGAIGDDQSAWPNYHAFVASDRESETESFSPTDKVPQVGNRKACNGRLSIWGFSHELRLLFDSNLGDPANYSKCTTEDSYGINSRASYGLQDSSTPVALPSKDYMVHLAQVVDFRLNSNYYFFNYTALLGDLNSSSSYPPVRMPQLWQFKLLMITALGKLYLEKRASDLGPPGVREFLQASKELPTNLTLSQNPVLAIEVLCLLAFYSQATDLHQAAYLYAEQACSIAHSCNSYIHDDPDPGMRPHVQKLWCTVCVLDQRCSVAIGAQPRLPWPEQGSTTLPSISAFAKVAGSSLRLNLSITNSLAKIFSVRSRGISVFLSTVPAELESLQGLANHITSTQKLCHDQSLLTISRPAATSHLLYCHCVILATKAALMQLAQSTRCDQSDSNAFSCNNMAKAAQTCISAAVLSLNIISALHDQGFIETFLFFDLEITYLSALILVLAQLLAPDTTNESFLNVAKAVLDDMSLRGNAIATSLSEELGKIKKITSDAVQTLRRSPALPFSFEPVRMIWDGRILSHAILGLIEVRPSATSSSHGLNSVQPTATNTSADNLWPQPDIVGSQTLSQSNSWKPPDLLVNGSLLGPSNELPAAGTDSLEGFLTFDMEDLQWLECVQ